MVEQAHTPTPWAAILGGRYIVPDAHRTRAVGGADNRDVDRDYYAQLIASLRDDDHERGTASANAAFIVQACNAHADLIAALTELRDYAASVWFDFDEASATDEERELLQRARAALAKASP